MQFMSSVTGAKFRSRDHITLGSTSLHKGMIEKETALETNGAYW